MQLDSAWEKMQAAYLGCVVHRLVRFADGISNGKVRVRRLQRICYLLEVGELWLGKDVPPLQQRANQT
jgi:hypothetical protein